MTFPIDPIIARQHGGTDDIDNLALSGLWCNLYKGPNLADSDPNTGELSALFHPRRDRWRQHFSVRGVHIYGRMPTGRTAVRVLNMNATEQLELRRELRDSDPS